MFVFSRRAALGAPHRLLSAYGVAIAVFVLAALAPTRASAQREHTVRSGQSLARIARRYRVTVPRLLMANSLRRNSPIRPGQVLIIPEEGVHYVRPGDTLARIARNYEVSVSALQRANRLRAGRSLQVGQRIVLPGFDTADERTRRRWGRPRALGVARLYRRSLDRELRVRLVDRRRRARGRAVRRLQEFMRPRGQRTLGPRPPSRLVEILARVSDHFGGRRITIVSGYRQAGGYTRESSRHTNGHALDLRIQGVPNEELRDFVRETFENVGVGYYPRSRFVHIDVRDRNSYWVDWSRPGEAPRYQRRGGVPDDASTDEREAAGVAAQSEEDAESPAGDEPTSEE